jgi:hypothetical protein
MDFEKTVPSWPATGTEPPSSLKTSGFQAGYKPPAPYFNWFWNRSSECLTELQTKLSAHETEVTTALDGKSNTSHTHSDATTSAAGFMSASDKTKLDGIATGANNYTHPSYTSRTTGFYKLAVNSLGHVYGVTSVGKGDITALGIPAQDTTYSNATTSKSGLMSYSDKQKLDQKPGLSVGGSTLRPTSTSSVVAGDGAEIFNDYSSRTFSGTTASSGNVATGSNSVAMGSATTAMGNGSFAAGYATLAKGYCSIATGALNEADGNYSHVTGYKNKVNGMCGSAAGMQTIATGCNFVVGINNAENGESYEGGNSSSSALFTVGNGASTTSRANVFRVSQDGKCRGVSSWTSSGADYAEMFEWLDGNENNEDRRGLFVTLDGEKVRLANSADDYILGVISADPVVLGDHSDDWHARYLTDVFGAKIMETRVNSLGQEVQGWAINPDYDPEQEYIGREHRKEWAQVGMLGKLVVVDDGTCTVNGYCYPNANGIATASETGYRVMKRIDDTHIRVMIK